MLAHIASASQKFTPTFADAAGVVNDAAQMQAEHSRGAHDPQSPHHLACPSTPKPVRTHTAQRLRQHKCPRVPHRDSILLLRLCTTAIRGRRGGIGQGPWAAILLGPSPGSPVSQKRFKQVVEIRILGRQCLSAQRAWCKLPQCRNVVAPAHHLLFRAPV